VAALDKKTIILVIALGLLVFFWIPIMTKLGLIKPAPAPVRQIGADSAQVSTQPVHDARLIDSAFAAPIIEAKSDLATDTTTPEEKIIIETDVWTVVMTNYGGGPISIKLKKYEYHGGGQIEMLPDCQTATPELTSIIAGKKLRSKPFKSSLPEGRYSATSSPLEITYAYYEEGRGSIAKRYRFYKDKYNYDLAVEITNGAGIGFEREYALEWNNPLRPTERQLFDDYNAMWAMAQMGSERVKFDDYTDNKYSVALSGSTNWIASRSKYFASIMVPLSGSAAGAKSSGIKINEATASGNVQARRITYGLAMEIPSRQNPVDSFSIFVGPMDYDLLKNFDHDVIDIIDIGTTPFVGWIIKIFAIPIMWLLPRMYNIIPNYGLVIIVFALLIKILIFPLSKKTAKSMMAMKELQPKMEELKKKHKNNPQALNKEMMKLYKDMGVNPFSGCLPYLPQLPLFFAMFAVFSSTILLRQAPFILWYTDLSRGALSLTDPYIVMVIIMMILMFVQQKMTMTDPKNKVLIYLMPLIMGFFFYKAAAGLVLYWTSFSLFSFIEQLLFKPKSLAPAAIKTQ
jgi:YidC/Oxa1 family membrane protein insertase